MATRANKKNILAKQFARAISVHYRDFEFDCAPLLAYVIINRRALFFFTAASH